MTKTGKNPDHRRGTTVFRKDPDVDVMRVWKTGYEPAPSLAEQLAADHADQESPVPGQQETHQYGGDPDDDGLGLDVPEPDELTAPGVTVLDGLEQFAAPDSEAAQVIPLNVAPVPELPPYDEAAVPVQVCGNGHESPAGAKFCMECGEPFQVQAATADWTCQNGHLIDKAAKFCMECGDARPDLRAPVAGAGVVAELSARVTPEAMLNPEQRAERERLHAAALRAGREDRELVFQRANPDRPGIWLHVRKSGWSFAGVVWMRGQNIYLEEGTLRWQEAQDWIGLDEAGQTARWGRECFRLGKWPGKQSYAEATEADYQKVGAAGAPSREQLAAADQAEAARGGGVPAPVLY